MRRVWPVASSRQDSAPRVISADVMAMGRAAGVSSAVVGSVRVPSENDQLTRPSAARTSAISGATSVTSSI